MSKMKPDRKPPLAKSPIRLRPRRVLGSNSNCMPTPAGRSEIGFEQTDKILTGGSLRKSEKARPTGIWEMEEAELRPEYRSISWELRALEKMVTGEELGKEDYCGGGGGDTDSSSSHRLSSLNSSPLFERGRFYEEYSARRNERLNRKNKITVKEGGCETNYSTTATSASGSKYKYNNKLGVTVESAKRTSTRTTTSSRKLQSLRKSVSAAYSVVETQQAPSPTPAPAPAPRYMLRSLMNKENMKPPLPQPTLYSSHQNHKSENRGGRKTGAPTPTPTPSPRVGYY
ncbi:unnamed protein product [Prunus armeniaca]|uniref:Uncharacterized protein n=1 Tax=Prunus armeniaca TaxID=36596 RepID=A0A6J5TQY3_PRUAR|nr:unnamed protein product [Prunus armeniaca]